MGKKYRIAIVGFGKMGKIRASCLKKHQDLELAVICEPNPVGVESGISVVADYRKVLDHHVDIVYVCTPNKYIAENVCFFLNHGKHVFSEKPPGRNKCDVAKMLEAQRSNPQSKLKFGFNHRYHQAVLDAKSLADKGRLGKILWVRGIYGKGGGPRYDQNWRNEREMSGGGILIDQGIHMIDLFRLFCGDFEEVKAFIGQNYWPANVEDNAFVMLRNPSGQVGMLHSSATQWKYKFQLDIYFEKGYASIAGILSSTMNYGTETLSIARNVYDGEGYPLPNPEESINYYEEDHSWDLELNEFISAIKEDAPIQVGSCEEAYKTMELIEAIYRSDQHLFSKTGIFLGHPYEKSHTSQ
ncbi:MAG: Gfo/Idh/MocA family oxidoreductase [Candidatus Omnitrophica bacterium]|nr:Gfo/Idh/MocA family oxidoreductase [Candidatus Omnitrophota bacterium]